MIAKNITKQPKSIIEVDVTVPWTDLQSAWDQVLTRMAADAELPGFRKGQAPLAMAEQQLGTKLQDEVLKTVMPNFLIEALKGTDIIPIDYPKYTPLAFSKGVSLQFKATITNRPQVTVGNYKTINVKRPIPKTVSEEEVNKVIDDLYKRSLRSEDLKRSLRSEDLKQWQAKQPLTAPSQPADKTPANAAGSISFQSRQTAEADDAFAKAMGATSLLDLKAKVRKDLEANVSYNNELDFEEAILQEVEKITTVELPEILIQDELNRMLVSLQRRVADMGLLLDDYLKSQGKTLEQLKNDWRVQAEKNVRMELGLAEIARMENVTISDEELRAEIDKIQDNKIKAQFAAEEPKLHLRHALRQTRTLDLLKKMVGS